MSVPNRATIELGASRILRLHAPQRHRRGRKRGRPDTLRAGSTPRRAIADTATPGAASVQHVRPPDGRRHRESPRPAIARPGRRALTVLALLFWTSLAAAAPDFADGVAAFHRGDYRAAAAVFLPLARRGHASAQNNLAVMYGKGLGVAEDYVESARWFRAAAEQGHPNAQWALGVMYATARGVARDHAAAARWFRAAAEQGYPNAQFNLGAAYARGEGVAPDPAQALAWFRRAAAQGHPKAQYNLGLAYLEGDGVARDPRTAAPWLQAAAEQGVLEARLAWASLLAAGEGVRRDDVRAYAWLLAAEASGEILPPGSARLRAALEARLTPAARDRAAAMARAWRPAR